MFQLRWASSADGGQHREDILPRRTRDLNVSLVWQWEAIGSGKRGVGARADVTDVSAAVGQALQTENSVGKTYYLGGPEILT